MRASLPSTGRLVSAVLALCCLLPAVSPATEKSSSYLVAIDSIRPDELQKHVGYLADDKLQGREAGRRGGRTAGAYLQGQLENLGLRGAGVDGGYWQPFAAGYRNVLGLLPGCDARLKDQVVIVCAHYDHVGYGSRRNSRGPIGRVHNGADDNASGTAVLLELAEAFTLLSPRPKRSVLFALFDAEEKGLLGSKHWVAQPTLPREDVVAVLNMDMVGRLRDDRLKVFGSRSGYGWRRLVALQNEDPGLHLEFSWELRAAADHYPFFRRGIPVLMMHTGVHDQYHTPRDDAELINGTGMGRVARLMFGVAYELADGPRPPAFRRAAGRETEWMRKRLAAHNSKPANRLGVRWQRQSSPGEGVRLTHVFRGSPAQKAGLRPGDRILEFAGRSIRVDGDLRGAVMGSESPAAMLVRRSGRQEPEELTVSLGGKPLRLGITWRVDDAEPGTAIITYVVAGSPAAEAGLRIGDRICQIAGVDFADQAQFAELAKTLPEPLEMLVERHGRLRTVVLKLKTEPP